MTGAAETCVILGAGPAGLTAAWEAMRLEIPAHVVEKDDIVGGIARTVEYKGYRFDIGGHRFFTKSSEVEAIWKEILGDAFLTRPRLSRIYYRDRFFAYPIRPFEALRGLGPVEAARIGASWLRAQVFPSDDERSFEQWVSNRFGRRLYQIFFQTYTEKVWGMPCAEISADWAAQRIQNLDLVATLRNALLGARGNTVTSLIEQFQYPRLGPGQLWETCRDQLAEGGIRTETGAEVVCIRHAEGRVRSVTLRDELGKERELPGAHFLSSLPIRELIERLDPAPPPEVIGAARRLRYRDFLTVALVVDRADCFPDNWIYVHSSDVKVGRIQNFKNWSPDMVPSASHTALGLEYFVQQGDELWTASDADLIELGKRECAQLGLVDASEVIDGAVVRMPKAYPVYDDGYRDALAEIRAYLDGLPNLQLIGRNGQHRYNNQDHSMLTALYAVRNVNGAAYDVWNVNVDDEYLEGTGASGDRLVPGGVTRDVDEALIRSAFARYDVFALGGALGIQAGAALFFATLLLLLRPDPTLTPLLSLLGNYLIGYGVTWSGAILGLVEAGAVGFAVGFLLAGTINALVGWRERLFRTRLGATLDLVAGGSG